MGDGGFSLIQHPSSNIQEDTRPLARACTVGNYLRAMKHLDENERILTVFGAFIMVVAIGLSVTTEVSARRHLAEHKRELAAPSVVQQGQPRERGHVQVDKHIGYAQETLDTRWDFPDGHATLGVGFGLFGLMMVAVPRKVAKKRVSGALSSG
jgi:hypothetical protein